MNPSRLLLGLLLVAWLPMAACESSSEGGAAGAADSATSAAASGGRDSARAERLADRLAERLADRLAARTDSAFEAVETLSSGEKRRLRRYLQDEHMARARRFGLDPVGTRRAAAGLAESDGVVRLQTNDFYIVDPRMGYAVPLLVPAAAHVLTRIGQRFQQALLAKGLPPYRFILTNVLRTGQDQAAMQGTNVNAAQGQSTHEYGTSFDIYYGRFHYAAVHDSLARHAGPPALDEARLRQALRRAYRGSGKAHARKLKAVLGRVLLQMQKEGLLLAIYEREQSVFHLTVADDVEAPAPWASSEKREAAMDAATRRLYADATSQISDIDDDLDDLAEKSSGDALAKLRSKRDRLQKRLDRLGSAAPSERSDARARLRQGLAQMEGNLEGARLGAMQSAGEIRAYLGPRLNEMDRKISWLEGRGADADASDALRKQFDVLKKRRDELQGTSGASFERARNRLADAAARLTTNLQEASGKEPAA